jgi:tRNA(Ile2) C34 agmatinyltransferase TiaS
MSSALMDAPTFAARRALRPAGERRPTLAERLESTLRAAHAHEAADCPLCHGPMHAAGGAARCESCGSTLS